MECTHPCQGFCTWISTTPHHVRYVLPKSDYPHLPRCFKETHLGEMMAGSRRQLRGPHGAHVHEFEDRWVLHRDVVDADLDPLGHLVKDAPEYLLSTALGLAICLLTGHKNPKGRAMLAGGLAGTMAFVSGKMMKMMNGDSSEGEGSAPKFA